jgi:TDG/mug DNA glycosylase family protein
MLQPGALAFNGKLAASVFYAVPTGNLTYGRQSDAIGQTAVYVLPSTSASAARHWSVRPWEAMARDFMEE